MDSNPTAAPSMTSQCLGHWPGYRASTRRVIEPPAFRER